MSKYNKPKLVLASASKSRRTMLKNAGITCLYEAAHIDEAVIKERMTKAGARPEEISQQLAMEKALAISPSHPHKIILGADQLLACDNKIFDKPRDSEEAEKHLRIFRGKSHILHTSYALIQDGKILLCYTEQPCLTMRNFSDTFLREYIKETGERITESVGCYFLEGQGSQLFSEIKGDYFTILGLPLLNVMENLRKLNILSP